MVEVTFKLSDKLASVLGGDPATIARHILEDAAVEGYRSGRLSQRDVADMVGMDYWHVDAFLAMHRAAVTYSLSELEADRASLGKITGGK